MTFRIWLVAIFAFTLGCGSASSDDGSDNTAGPDNGGKTDTTGDATMCAAVRGNGQLISAHYGALARIVEHYGPLDGIGGGSSASITSFLVESMQMNPLITQCGDAPCSDAQTRARLGLLLKSFQGYIETLTQSDEALAIQSLAPIAARVQEAGLESVIAEDPIAANAALQEILTQEDLVKLVNPELIGLLQTTATPDYHVADITASIQGFGSFAADDPKIMVRPGVLDFSEIANQMGTAGSFYAGYGGAFPAETMEKWFEACAEPGVGQSWSAVRAMPAGDTACGPLFYGMLAQYRAEFALSEDASRIDDKVGAFLPSLISTSVLTGDAVDAWKAAKAQYDSGTDPVIDIDFEDVKFGYWGSADALAALDRSERKDLKSEKAIGLGQATWRTALSLSPAEPGLARGLAIDDEHISVGGWSDLHPVLALKDMGCDKVVYVTRTDEESGFAQGVASVLGMDAEGAKALYDLNNPNSSFSISLAEADAVMCTKWNAFEGSQFEELANDAYGAPLQTTDAFFTGGDNAYGNTTDDTGLVGCTVPQ